MSPTVVYVNALLDREGKPRGFEKSGQYYMDQAQAEIGRRLADGKRKTVECVIMSRDDYDALVHSDEVLRSL